MARFPARAPTAGRFLRLFPAVLISAGLLASMSLAQDAAAQNKPRSLIPGLNSDQGPDAQDNGPGTSPFIPSAELPATEPRDPAEPRARPEDGAGSSSPSRNGIVAGRLDAVDPSSVGLLSPADGGFGFDMWAGTPRTIIDRLLPHVPVATRAPLVQDLTRRLLLTSARVPVDETEDGANESRPSQLSVRAGRLLAMGRLRQTRALLARAPDRLQDPALARADAEAALLLGEADGACTKAPIQVGRSQDIFWQKLVAFCRRLQGEEALAAVSVDLLRERLEPGDAFFPMMAALAGGAKPDAARYADASPLEFAMLRAAKVAPDSAALRGAKLPVLAALSRADGVAENVRLAATEDSEEFGATETADLLARYRALSFDQQEMAAALNGKVAGSETRQAALYHHLGETTVSVGDKVAVLRKALELGRDRGRFMQAARVNYRAIRTVPPSPDQAAFGGLAAVAALAAGDHALARMWASALRIAAVSADTAAAETAQAGLARLEPLLLLAGADPEAVWSARLFEGWRTLDVDAPGAEDRDALLLTLAEALGHPVSEGEWRSLIGGGGLRTQGERPAAPVSRLLWAASGQDRLGETLLLAVVALGESAYRTGEPETLGQVVRVLRQVGLEDEARRLALEAALVRGS